MRVAVFSDVHSNLPALRAVLESIFRENVDLVLCGGDLVGYGSFPNEVVQTIRERRIPTVMGNYDDGVGFDRDDCGCVYPTRREAELGKVSLEWTKKNLNDENKAFLRSLPFSMEHAWKGFRVLHVHGSPRRMNEYLYEDRPEKSLLRMLKPLNIDVLICGHTHIPYHRTVGGIHVINTGSVGKPRDGDPRACYTLIEIEEDLKVSFRRVPYNVEEACRAIKRAGLPEEYAEALRNPPKPKGKPS